MTEPRQTVGWAMQLAPQSAAALGNVRLLERLQILWTPTAIWLRGPLDLELPLDARLKALPAERRYRVMDNESLIPEGGQLPCGRLPAGRWKALRDWLQPRFDARPVSLESPLEKRPGESTAGNDAETLQIDVQSFVPLRMVPCHREATANLLLTTATVWRRCAGTLAEVRLNRLQFAAAHGDQVLIRGEPLPPIPGRYFVDHGGVAVEAGHHWSPAFDVEVLLEVLAVGAAELILLTASGGWQRVGLDGFVGATRAAVRATWPQTGATDE